MASSDTQFEGDTLRAGRFGVRVSPFKKSAVASLIIATQMGGTDPLRIVGGENFFQTEDNPNAFGPLAADRGVKHASMPKLDELDIPATPKGGGGTHDPYAGQG